MKNLTVTQKLTLGTATMLAVGLVAMSLVVSHLYATYRVTGQLMGRQDAFAAVTYELAANATDAAADASTYVATGDERFRIQFEQHRAVFFEFMARFDSLAGASAEGDHAARLRSLFGDLTAAAQRLMDRRDEQAAIIEKTVDDRDQLARLLQALRATGNGGVAREDARRRALLHDIVGPAATSRQAQIVAALVHCAATFQEHVDAAFSRAVMVNDDRRTFVAARDILDHFVENDLRALAETERRASQQTMSRMTRRAILLMALLVPILLAVGLMSTAWVVVSIRFPMAALVDGISAFGQGHLDHRVHLVTTDEFGTLAAAFNWMAEQVQRSEGDLRALSARGVSSREAERKALAREIHDDLGQTLTALKIGLSRLDGCCRHADDDSKDVRALQAELTGLVESGISTMRRVASGLRPSVLDQLGISAAIEWQVSEFERQTRISCDLDVEDIDPPIDDERAIACFRIVQEALTNVARHSGATHVSVRVEARPDTLVVEVADNGKGIADEKLSGADSLGLLGMRERVQAFGGRVRFDRVETGGTCVLVEMPRQPLSRAACKPDSISATAGLVRFDDAGRCPAALSCEAS